MANKGTSKRWEIDFHEMEKWYERFDKAGRSWAPYIEDGLTKCHRYITKNLERDAVPSNYPAGGKYSTGGTAKSIYRDPTVHWLGSKNAYVKVGFDHKKSYVPLILMYGTPKIKPVRKLYNDIYSRKTRSECRALQLDDIEQWWEDSKQK